MTNNPRSSDPLQQPESPLKGTLFDSTSRLAGDTAAKSVAGRRSKILNWIEQHGPSTLFEVAAGLGVFDHQISGRFTELAKDGLIERTGDRRTKPETTCPAEVWRLATPAPSAIPKDLADQLGYPMTLQIPGEGLFQKWTILDADNAPAIPYVLHDSAAGLKLRFRVSLIECDGCGRPLKMVSETVNGQPRKVYRCGTPNCNRTWHLQLVKEPGGPELLAIVLKTM